MWRRRRRWERQFVLLNKLLFGYSPIGFRRPFSLRITPRRVAPVGTGDRGGSRLFVRWFFSSLPSTMSFLASAVRSFLLVAFLRCNTSKPRPGDAAKPKGAAKGAGGTGGAVTATTIGVGGVGGGGAAERPTIGQIKKRYSGFSDHVHQSLLVGAPRGSASCRACVVVTVER